MTSASASTLPRPVHIIGGGLAGSEAAWQLACAGVPVVLHEMRPQRQTDAHQTDGLAELVCSNSFRSDDSDQNAVGLIHWEMRRLGSLIMREADAHQVPAGGALAVDREGFSQAVTQALEAHPLVTIVRKEIPNLALIDCDINIRSCRTEHGRLQRCKALERDVGVQRLLLDLPPPLHQPNVPHFYAWHHVGP